MHYDSTQNPLLDPLRRGLTKPQWQNLLALVVAVQLGRTLVLRQLSLFLLWRISSASCYRRLQRILAWEEPRTWQPLRRFWVQAVLRTFAPGRGRVPLIIDWTWHRDRCRSLWVMLPVGGRAVPLCFWLTARETGGAGTQRSLEDTALTELSAWLGRRGVILIGDRGFRGRDRIRLLQRLGWHFVLRLSAETELQTPDGWAPLGALLPPLGGHWHASQVLLGKPGKGKGKKGAPVCVTVVAARGALAPAAPPQTKWGRGTHRGQRTRPPAEETTWFLATDLGRAEEALQLYAWRMQIEQTFRDYKSLFGMEQEKTHQPWERLQALLWALQIGETLAIQAGEPATRVASVRPGAWQLAADEATARAREAAPHYPAESVVRRGLHELLVQLVWGTSPLSAPLQAVAQKSERMQQRPQVQFRRRSEPALRRRSHTTPGNPPA
jgi:Transposase DDE domain